jgi:hypothetical protein
VYAALAVVVATAGLGAIIFSHLAPVWAALILLSYGAFISLLAYASFFTKDEVGDRL